MNTFTFKFQTAEDGLDAVTSTVTVHEPLAGIERVAGSVTVVPPIVAATEPVPEQVVLAFVGFAINTPMGNVSMSDVFSVATVLLELLKVMVRVEGSPSSIVAGLKALPSVGETAGVMTVKVAMAGAALLPLLVCKALMASELK